MRKGKDIAAEFSGLYLVHQNIPGKKLEETVFEQHILFIPLQGEIRVEVKDRSLSLGLGQMLFLPAKMRHSFSSSAQSGERMIAMIATHKLHDATAPVILPMHQLIKEILFYLLLHPQAKSAKALVSVFFETLSEALGDSVGSEFSLDHLAGRVKDPRVKEALADMRENLDAKPSMNQIARNAGLSLRSFNRQFAAETGIPPKQWLIQLRIEKAKELLKKPGTSVTEVALAVGYSSLGQFIATFRSKTGQLPSEYLKRG
jgi:AraC-like DNA-binding protein